MILDLKISIPDPADKEGFVDYLKFAQKSYMWKDTKVGWFLLISDLNEAKLLSVKEGKQNE